MKGQPMQTSSEEETLLVQESGGHFNCQPPWKIFAVGGSLLLATAVLWVGGCLRDHSNVPIDSTISSFVIPPTWPSGGDLPYAPHCMPYPGRRVILVTVSNDFLDMFLNWFHTAEAYINNETDQLVVVPYDELVASKLRDMSSNSHLSFWVGQVSSARRLYDYVTPGYSKVVNSRPNLLKYWLEKNCTVFYVDIDTVWLRPVFPVLMKEAGARSLYLIKDGTKDRFENGKLDFCSCFIYANPTPMMKKLMSDWAVNIKGESRNQPGFNEALKSSNVDYAVLPEPDFPNGKYADAHHINRSATVLHANWRIGMDKKIAFFKERGLWFL